MNLCPTCKREYRDDVKTCEDCPGSVALIAKDSISRGGKILVSPSDQQALVPVLVSALFFLCIAGVIGALANKSNSGSLAALEFGITSTLRLIGSSLMLASAYRLLPGLTHPESRRSDQTVHSALLFLAGGAFAFQSWPFVLALGIIVAFMVYRR